MNTGPWVFAMCLCAAGCATTVVPGDAQADRPNEGSEASDTSDDLRDIAAGEPDAADADLPDGFWREDGFVLFRCPSGVLCWQPYVCCPRAYCNVNPLACGSADGGAVCIPRAGCTLLFDGWP